MKRNLIAGAVVMALTLTTGAVAYAASAPQEKQLPEGVVYMDEISMGGEGALSFEDRDNLPEGVVYMDEVSMGGENAQNLPLEPAGMHHTLVNAE